MAYWGMAMSNFNNSKRAKVFMEEAEKRKEGVTDVERRFIEALSACQQADPGKKEERAEKYAKALEDICIKYPKTLKQAFLALQLWSNRYNGIPITSYVAIDLFSNRCLRLIPSIHPITTESIYGTIKILLPPSLESMWSDDPGDCSYVAYARTYFLASQTV